MSRWLAMVTLVVVAGAVRGWDCVCNPRECEALEPSGCPGLGMVVWDPCRCCKVCARTLGEDCGGFHGTCEPGLKCFEGSCTPITCCKVCARTLGEDCGGFHGTCEPGLKCFEGSCTPIT